MKSVFVVIISLLVSLLTSFAAFAQPTWSELKTHELLNSNWSPEEIAMANTAKNVPYLTQTEKEVILYTNLARLDGSKFADTFVMGAIKNWWATSDKTYQQSLIRDLKKVKGLRMLVPDKRLYEAAKFHAIDLSKSGSFGHNSTATGEGPYERIARYWGDKYLHTSECCDRCFNSGLEIVLHFLFDEKVPSLGHRKALVNKSLLYVGTNIQSHILYNWVCVMDFVGDTVKVYRPSRSSSSRSSAPSIISNETPSAPQSVTSPLSPRSHTNSVIYLLIVIAIQLILACFKAKPYVHAAIVALLLTFFYLYDVPDFVKIWREKVENVVDDGK